MTNLQAYSKGRIMVTNKGGIFFLFLPFSYAALLTAVSSRCIKVYHFNF